MSETHTPPPYHVDGAKLFAGEVCIADFDTGASSVFRSISNAQFCARTVNADAADQARIAELEAALVSPYCGLLVLKAMMRKAGLEGGVKVTEEVLADLVALHPALPALSALRTSPAVGPGYVDQPDFIYFECKECGFDSVQQASFIGEDWCPMCASDNHDTRMAQRVCRNTDKPEGTDARAALLAAGESQT